MKGKSYRGSITVEAAIVVPTVVFILYILITFSLDYYHEVINKSINGLRIEAVAITGEYRTNEIGLENYVDFDEPDYTDPKWNVRIADALDDATDQIAFTYELKKKYSDMVDEIKDIMSAF